MMGRVILKSGMDMRKAFDSVFCSNPENAVFDVTSAEFGVN